MADIRTRTAPSPTGRMHIGTVRTALFNYLYAKKHAGSFVVRIEDTDKERNKPEYETAIWEDLAWCGLNPDEKYRQSDLVANHARAIRTLVDNGRAYISSEPSTKDPNVMQDVVRLKNPNTTVTFADIVRGDISFDTTELGDFVIARRIDDPLYHLAVVVDDHDMRISHVFRAEEHISNTPRQILIQEGLGYERPLYGHFPLVLAPDRTKLSKRRHAVGIDHFRELGFLPEALINYLALLGWNPGGEQEIFSLDELVQLFDIAKIQKSGGVFDIEKLKWFNRAWLLRLPEGRFADEAASVLKSTLHDRGIEASDARLSSLVPIIRERIAMWSELKEAVAAGEYDYFFTEPALDPAKLPNKNSSPAEAAMHLTEVRKVIDRIPSAPHMEARAVKDAVWPYAEAQGRGTVLWPLRYALTGKDRSPDPFIVASVIGREDTLARIDAAIQVLS